MRPLAELLTEHSEGISRRWLERFSNEVLPQREPELRLHLPSLLTELSQALAQQGAKSEVPLVTHPPHRLGFDLDMVVRESALLRDCVLEVLESEGAQVQLFEVRILMDVFSNALARAVSQNAQQAGVVERELFMQAPVAIAILEGPEHRFTFANPAYCALVNGRDVVGKPLLEALPDLRGQGFDSLLDRVMATGETFFGKEVPLRLEHHRDGELLFLNFVYTVRRDASGAADGVMVSGFDVTDQVLARKSVEALAEKVRSSEAELRLVANALPVLVSFVTQDERYAMVNKAYEDWFGVAYESLVGRTLQEVIGDSAYAQLRPYVLRALAGEAFSFEQHAVPYRLGGTRDIKVWFIPRLSAEGSVDGYVALLQDVTVQRRAEQVLAGQSLERLERLEEARRMNAKLAEAEVVLRNLVNNLPELAWSAEPGGHIDFYNQRWFEYTGTTLEEMNGWGWEKVHDPAILPKVTERWRRSLATGEPFEMEFPLRAADGSFQWFLTRVRALRDGSGNILRWIGTNTNIHEQRETVKRAEEASRAKDEFLATASHELRTPLNAILGWARMLRSGQLEPSAYMRGLETIERNAKAQVQLIEDILDGSRIITGNLHLEIRPLDMTSLVQAALDAVRPAAEAKGIELSVGLDPAAARIVGDPERLQQVVWNLANNAVKFTPKGGAIQVNLQRSGTSIELCVSDSGQGIDQQFLPFVFDRFRQAEGSTTRRHGGLGLGLALVRHLVEAHGGTVSAESAGHGQGSRFVVLLPVQAVFHERADSNRPAHGAVDESPPFDVRESLLGVTVLVVDDEADARELVATVLRANGAEVTTAANAAQAMAMLAKVEPMVLISDIGMPDVDGYELIRRVRSSARHHAEVPAIALTAYSREQDRRLALEAGFQTHVAKPVEPAELVRVVRSLARSSRP